MSHGFGLTNVVSPGSFTPNLTDSYHTSNISTYASANPTEAELGYPKMVTPGTNQLDPRCPESRVCLGLVCSARVGGIGRVAGINPGLEEVAGECHSSCVGGRPQCFKKKMNLIVLWLCEAEPREP